MRWDGHVDDQDDPNGHAQLIRRVARFDAHFMSFQMAGRIPPVVDQGIKVSGGRVPAPLFPSVASPARRVIIPIESGVRRLVVAGRIGKTVQIRRGPAAVTGDDVVHALDVRVPTVAFVMGRGTTEDDPEARRPAWTQSPVDLRRQARTFGHSAGLLAMTFVVAASCECSAFRGCRLFSLVPSRCGSRHPWLRGGNPDNEDLSCGLQDLGMMWNCAPKPNSGVQRRLPGCAASR